MVVSSTTNHDTSLDDAVHHPSYTHTHSHACTYMYEMISITTVTPEKLLTVNFFLDSLKLSTFITPLFVAHFPSRTRFRETRVRPPTSVRSPE